MTAMNIMHCTTKAIFKRELTGYFETPVAYVFIVVFLALSGIFTFYMGNFYQQGEANLTAFFTWHPWLYLFLIPAVSMRLWSEERKSGTLELLLTLPVSTWRAVWGKFLAAWAFSAIALALTFPIWITVSYLGDPDHGVIIASYVGSALMAGAYLAVGSCMSSITRNQVIAFVLAIVVCFIFTLAGFPLVISFFQGWLPQVLVDLISSFGFSTHFNEISSGILAIKSIIFFLSFIALWLFLNTLILTSKRG
jgi:ABC-2 type transport system permease protein